MSRHMGPSDAQALIGKWYQVVGANPWQQIVGADVQVRPQRGGYQQPWQPPQQPQYAVAPYQQPAYQQPAYAAPAPAVYYGAPAPAYHPQAYNPRAARRRTPGPHGGIWQFNRHRRTWMGADPTEGSEQIAGFPPRNALIDAPGPERAGREVLPMSTGVPIDPFQSAQITARPQRVAFRPERVFISSSGTPGGAADWVVNDIKIGNRSQFSQSGDIPGDMFAANAIDGFVSFETAQTAMDVVMVVTYMGPQESGVPFYGSIVGTAAI